MIRIYYRVSTDKQDFAAQENGVETILRNNSIQKTDCVVYKDYALSGTTTERPEYQRLMSELQPRDIIVVFEISRLWRDTEEQGRAIKLFLKNDIHILASDGNFIDINDFLSIGIKGVINQYEAARTKLRAAEGIKAAQLRVAAGDRTAWRGRGPDKKPRKKEGYQRNGHKVRGNYEQNL
jgi:DNA invertase Pin-like site-specific DNA recombinase